PLPILIAALGWSHMAGLIAAASATAAIVALSGTFFVAVPVIAFGAWWLGYLALLARPATNGGGAVRLYPARPPLLWGGGGRRRRSQFRHRPADPAGRLAQDLRTHSARPVADRPVGGRCSAGRGRVLHHYQRIQSLARRACREDLRPAQAAMAGFGGLDVTR